MKIIRCSSLARIMQCAGFSTITDLPPNTSNDAAKLGTAAGEYLEAMLTQRTITPKVNLQAENGVYFDEEMKFHLVPFAKELLNTVEGEILCETRIDWMSESGVQIRGQYDMSYVLDNTLFIEDLKYGYGIIDPKENWQLLGYAIGEVIRQGRAFDEIVLRIFQPRPRHEDGPLREWRITYQELLNYKAQIEKQLKKVAMGLKELVSGKSCKWCPAAGERCPAINRALYEGVDIVMSDFTQDTLNDADIAKELGLLERINEIVKIKKDSLEQLSVSRIKNGSIIPGFVIEESFGNRYWKKNVTPESLEVITGMDLSEKTILSPAKCEKLGVGKEVTEALTNRWSRGVKLVRKDTGKIGDKIFGKPEVVR
jgi:hypothetical protein